MKDLINISSLKKPSDQEIYHFRLAQQNEQPNYDDKSLPQRVEIQSLEVQIGKGRKDYLRAESLVKNWRVFGTPDAIPYPPESPPQIGQTTVTLLREFGIWFKVACRITEVIKEPNRYGFTFETLPGHVECGWETFSVRYDPQSDLVYYSIQSEAAHRFWLIWLGSPVVHWLQRRYKRNSARYIKELTQAQG